MKASLFAIAASAGIASAWPRLRIASSVVEETVLSETGSAVSTLYAYQTVSPTTAAVATVYGSPAGTAAVATYYSADGESQLVEPTTVSETYWRAVQHEAVTGTAEYDQSLLSIHLPANKMNRDGSETVVTTDATLTPSAAPTETSVITSMSTVTVQNNMTTTTTATATPEPVS